VRIISRKKLIAFYEQPQYRDAKEMLEAWWYEANHADWKTPADIKAKYGKASFLANNRVVFNICGNKYRLIVMFNYQVGIGLIRFIGTHQQYDQVDAENI